MGVALSLASLIARFTQIDYAPAMAFVALSKDRTELLGVARLAAVPTIGTMNAEGLRELEGTVPAADTGMLQMCREFGFTITAHADDQSALGAARASTRR